MADPVGIQSFADQLNRAAASTQQPGPGIVPAPPPNAPPVGTSWSDRFKNYIGGTDWGNLAEAMYRLNPITGGALALKDVLTEGPGKAIENQRLIAGQLSRFPTDVASGVVGFYPALASARSLITGEPVSGFAETLGGAADAIDEFGRKNWAEPIAGRPLGKDEQGNELAGSLLRGTAPEMAGNWARLMSQAIVPLPTKVAAPIIEAGNLIRSGINTATGGIKAIDTATVLAGKVVEGLTPLAISSAPSAKVAALNLGISGAINPLAEAAVEAAIAPSKQANAVQSQADQLGQQGSAQATQGAEEIGKAVKPTLAGGLTGDTGTDLTILGAAIGVGFAGYKLRDKARRVADGLVTATTGYKRLEPNDASIQSGLTKVQQQLSKGDASLFDTLEKTLKSHGGQFSQKQIDDYVLRAKEDAATRRGAATNTRARNWLFTGEYMDTPIKSKAGNDLFVEHQAATPAQQKAFSQAEWADQELNTRQRMLQKGFNQGQSPLGASPIGSPGAERALLAAEQQASYTPQGATTHQNKYAHNLSDMTSRDLVAIRNAGNADPVVLNLRRGFRDIINKSGDYMGMEKRFTAPQVAEFKRNNPNYVPPKIKDGENFLNDRDPVNTFNPSAGTGVPRGARTFEELGNPMHTLPRYMDEVFRSTEGMKTKRDFMITMNKAARTGNLYAQQILGREIPGKPGVDAAERFVSWRDANGNQRWTEIKDAVVRDALRGATSPTALQLAHGFAAQLTRYFESGAVGAFSLAGGTVFAPKSALYTITAGTVLPRPKGVAMGWIDRLSQSAGGPQIRGDVVTMALDSLLVRAPANIAAVLVERGGRIMHNQLLTNGMLTKAVDPVTLRKWADAAEGWYKTTNMYDMQKQGLMGPGSFMAVDPAKVYQDPARALEGAKGLFGSGGHFVADILHAISAAPAMSIKAMNDPFNVPKWKTSSAIRNMTGDPGQSGAFRNFKGGAAAVNVTPWGNIYIQSLAKLASTFKSKEEIARTAGGIMTGVAMPAAMATMWNQSQGPEYSQYQFFGRTPDKTAASVYIAVPGRAPNEGIEIDLDPLMRPFKTATEAFMGMMTGAFSGELWKPENADEKRMYEEMMNNRWTGTGTGSVLRSLFQQTVIPPIPTPAQGILAAGGVQARSYIDMRTPDARKTQGFAEGTNPGGDNVFDHVIPGLAEDVLRAVGGNAGGFIYDFFGGMQRDLSSKAPDFGNETKTPIQAATTQIKEWKMKVADSTAELGSGPLFGTFRAITPSQEAASQVVKGKLDGMKAVIEQYKATTVKGAPREMIGTSGKFTNQTERLGAGPAQPTELQGAIASEINRLYTQLQPTLSEIKSSYTQKQSLQNSNLFSPEMKRGMQELEADKIISLNRRLLQDLQRAEQNMSNRYGVKIKFDDLKQLTQ